MRVATSRPIWSVPSQWLPLMVTNRSRRFVSANPYGVSTSARTASSSMTMTMAAPIVPSGLRRTIVNQTSTYHGRVRAGRRTSRASVEDGAGARVAIALAVPDPRVQERVGEVDGQVEADHHRRDDEVHRLHDRVVQARERLEEEETDAGQTEDRLDD